MNAKKNAVRILTAFFLAFGFEAINTET